MDIPCEFCMLAANASDEKAKAIIIDNTENVIAFRNMRSKNTAHVLIIPKKHVTSVLDADDVLVAELMSVVKNVAQEITIEYGACRIFANVGEYQDLKHLHWHVVYEG